MSEAPIEVRVDGLPELTELPELAELATVSASASASCASMIKCAIFLRNKYLQDTLICHTFHTHRGLAYMSAQAKKCAGKLLTTK